ncbi:hypothetical protein AMAG_06060 [Allomyces macrogynus ATCC 38327]|uniref:ATP-dependent DNA ligase family profile domain-containing protein n=1 Tax=Allomyces macrogynus (strain ATCC 38327) TaxID=578462 RepID=A0A0L0SDY7_ALLM3|nr:hypothetical protein AMAG_06060 [Allomyces macrogynus ATCC 38327]|eukprot:KNE60696.1 hypothetical protein AMAG_06060 [Allomyces macrogynus ATCC 38327]
MARNGIKFDAFDMLRPQWQEVARKYITPHVGIPIEPPNSRQINKPEDILRTKANMYCVERKYDGERKSKRDSTVDRADTHPIIFAALHETVHSCVLEAEMITIDVTTKNGSRSTDCASMGSDPTQQLFLVIFDVIVHNGESLIVEPLHRRRALLDQIIRHVEGRAAMSPYAVVSPHNVDEIMTLFTHEVVHCHEEGLMLKDWGASYSKAARTTIGSCLADRRRVQDDLTALNIWDHHALMTHLIIDAVEDQADISRGTKPTFKVFFAVETGTTAALIDYHLKYSTAESDVPLPEYLFTAPLVAELYGAEILKPPDHQHYTLRHPRIKQIRTDVQWIDCMSFAQVKACGRQFGDRKGKVMAEQRTAIRKWAGSMVDDDEQMDEGEAEGDTRWMRIGSTQMTTQRAGGWSSSVPVPPIVEDDGGDETDVVSDAATEVMDMDVDEENVPWYSPTRAVFDRAAFVQKEQELPAKRLAGAHVMVDHLTDAIIDELLPVMDEYCMFLAEVHERYAGRVTKDMLQNHLVASI